MDSFAILLLTGGYSRRMGQNKANLFINNQTFAEKIAAELSSCGPVYLSVSADISPTLTTNAAYPCIVDEENHIGPLGGISAAMHQIDADIFFVCACDMPLISAAFVRHLMCLWNQVRAGDSIPCSSGSPGSPSRFDSDSQNQSASGDLYHPGSDTFTSLRSDSPNALLVRNRDGRIYTTAGIYHRSILPQIEKQIREKNYRLRDLLAASNVFYVDEESLGELKECLININTMKDYQKMLKNSEMDFLCP